MTAIRSDSFVPLTAAPAASAATGTGAKIISDSPASVPFRPLERLAPASLPPGSLHPSSHAEPVVSLQREAGRVSGIRIQCACGQIIELVCSYDPA